MSTKERIFHSLFFEIVALSLLIPLGSLFSDVDMGNMTGLAIGLSLTAMCWNYVYNLMFDKKFGTNRIERTLTLRIAHGLFFELGLLFTTLPAIMWILNMDLITALILDMGMIIFFMVFAIIYNWAYDLAKHRLVST
ncbi:hypothetical protein CXF85_21955 [Colwellia sp. 75C3]|uniref:PACE efflux transporter n=1 Tax=Colwellia sp. 75C3 TaxID=888425 RepID=UPI000C33ACF8|nr:PACE efflux transporter [Colwellia sp. 75C3]PKG80776.1 hypothetical protein CXF85_21955 [Colwellia sp. 75C3]